MLHIAVSNSLARLLTILERKVVILLFGVICSLFYFLLRFVRVFIGKLIFEIHFDVMSVHINEGGSNVRMDFGSLRYLGLRFDILFRYEKRHARLAVGHIDFKSIISCSCIQ